MFDIVDMTYEHLEHLLNQKMNANVLLRDGFSNETVTRLRTYSDAKAGLIAGEPMVCAGITKLWTGRGHLWCVLSEKIVDHPITVFRGMRRYLNSQPFNRVEMDNPFGFTKGHKRALMLGFEIQCLLARKYLPGGGDASTYAWVRD
jgi:hypothetical protein